MGCHLYHQYEYINPAKKETLHLFKGQQRGNKSVDRVVIYIGFWKNVLATI